MKYLFPLLAATLIFSSCKKNEEVEHEPVAGLQEITSQNQIQNEVANGVSLVFFHASWCSICHQQRPAVSEVAQDTDLTGVFFGEVEFDNYPDIVDHYNVDAFPTIVIFKDGNEVDRFLSSGHSASLLKTTIQSHQ